MDGLPWFAVGLIGLCFGIFVGCILGACAMHRLSEVEKTSNKK